LAKTNSYIKGEMEFAHPGAIVLFERKSLLEAIRQERYALANMEVKYLRPEQFTEVNGGVIYRLENFKDVIDYVKANNLVALGTLLFRNEYKGTPNVQSGYDLYFLPNPEIDQWHFQYVERLLKVRVERWFDKLVNQAQRSGPDAPAV
jgi:hypothetical protein